MIDSEHLKGLMVAKKEGEELPSHLPHENTPSFPGTPRNQTNTICDNPTISSARLARFFSPPSCVSKKLCIRFRVKNNMRHLIFESTKRNISVLQIHDCKYVTGSRAT